MANVITAVATVVKLTLYHRAAVMSKSNDNRKKRIAAAYKDAGLRALLTYANNLSPTDVGLPEEFGCVVWLAFYYSLPHCYGCTCCAPSAVRSSRNVEKKVNLAHLI